jgi:hypothetical protein
VTLEAIDAWKLAVGAEGIINLAGKIIHPDNPEVRTAMLKFLQENKEQFNKADLD